MISPMYVVKMLNLEKQNKHPVVVVEELRWKEEE